MIAAARDKFQAESKTLEKRLQELSKHHSLLKAQYAQEREANIHNMRSLMQQEGNLRDELAEYREFTLQPEIRPLHLDFVERKRAEQLQRQQERERQEAEARQQAERERHIRQEREAVPQRHRSRMR